MYGIVYSIDPPEQIIPILECDAGRGKAHCALPLPLDLVLLHSFIQQRLHFILPYSLDLLIDRN
ncbi:MAG: hypothetical protein ACRC2R_07640 [Xenococcaceae cyanobacterium]